MERYNFKETGNQVDEARYKLADTPYIVEVRQHDALYKRAYNLTFSGLWNESGSVTSPKPWEALYAGQPPIGSQCSKLRVAAKGSRSAGAHPRLESAARWRRTPP